MWVSLYEKKLAALDFRRRPMRNVTPRPVLDPAPDPLPARLEPAPRIILLVKFSRPPKKTYGKANIRFGRAGEKQLQLAKKSHGDT